MPGGWLGTIAKLRNWRGTDMEVDLSNTEDEVAPGLDNR
jgi:hypothetical protein